MPAWVRHAYDWTMCLIAIEVVKPQEVLARRLAHRGGKLTLVAKLRGDAAIRGRCGSFRIHVALSLLPSLFSSSSRPVPSLTSNEYSTLPNPTKFEQKPRCIGRSPTRRNGERSAHTHGSTPVHIHVKWLCAFCQVLLSTKASLRRSWISWSVQPCVGRD